MCDRTRNIKYNPVSEIGLESILSHVPNFQFAANSICEIMIMLMVEKSSFRINRGDRCN